MRRLTERYRFPNSLAKFSSDGDLSQEQGFFRIDDTICFGACSAQQVASSAGTRLYDVCQSVRFDGSVVSLPFDPDQIVDNMLLERYVSCGPQSPLQALVHAAYYAVRPLLGVRIRKHLQRIHLAGWEKTPFPHWPVDVSVERILEYLLMLMMQSRGLDAIPFIWFWPDGYDSCAIITHDVETETGRDFCPSLMDLDDACNLKASFQLVPRDRYRVSPEFLSNIRDRGFEVNVHDLNHDGSLFRKEQTFRERAAVINQYGRQFGANGFRSGAMYRNQSWYDALDFEYDMSVPNSAHLEPQRGGCGTVLPYFIGRIVELPLTVTQDYALFHFLRDYSMDLWHSQTDMIVRNHGLISVLVHPDYVIEKSAQNTYVHLLRHLSDLRDSRNVWTTLPGAVNSWWRTRNGLSLVLKGSGWQIEGVGKERAQVAFACLKGKSITYRLDNSDPMFARSTAQLFREVCKNSETTCDMQEPQPETTSPG